MTFYIFFISISFKMSFSVPQKQLCCDTHRLTAWHIHFHMISSLARESVKSKKERYIQKKNRPKWKANEKKNVSRKLSNMLNTSCSQKYMANLPPFSPRHIVHKRKDIFLYTHSYPKCYNLYVPTNEPNEVVTYRIVLCALVPPHNSIKSARHNIPFLLSLSVAIAFFCCFGVAVFLLFFFMDAIQLFSFFFSFSF